MISEKDIEFIDNYLKGKLNKNEMDLFNERLSNDNEFAMSYNEIKVFASALKSSVLKEKMSMLKEFDKSKNKAKQSKSFSLYYKIAAAVAIFAIALIFFNKGNSIVGNDVDRGRYTDMFGEKFSENLILHETLRAAEPTDNLTQEQRRAYELYSIQEFDMASPLLKTLWETKKDTLALFYHGVSELGRGNVKVGEEVLKRAELMSYKQLIK